MLARGGSILAASLLVVLGLYHFFAGIAGFAQDNFYTVGANYPYDASNDAWAWIHVIGGVLITLTGLALFSRSTTWARPVAIALCVISAMANFFFLAFFPLWALLMIGLAVFCIWALARDGMQANVQAQGIAGQQAGMQQREQVGAGAAASYGPGQAGQRWPENVGGRGEQGRNWAPADAKEGAGRPSDKPQQEQAAAGARGAGQAGRTAAEQAAQRAQQAGRDYGSNR
jgi:hypothetical protein